MSARFSVDGTQTTIATPDTILSLGGATTLRYRVYDFNIGSDSAPEDSMLVHTVTRHTAQGTGTTVVAQPLDFDDPAAIVTAKENHTSEPTYVAAQILHKVSLAQRATYRWVAVPGGELVMPAAADDGIGWFATHASSVVDVQVNAHFEE